MKTFKETFIENKKSINESGDLFKKTADSLQDCFSSLMAEDSLSASEAKYAKELLELCKDMFKSFNAKHVNALIDKDL